MSQRDKTTIQPGQKSGVTGTWETGHTPPVKQGVYVPPPVSRCPVSRPVSRLESGIKRRP